MKLFGLIRLSYPWKKRLAWLVRLPVIKWLLVLAVHIFATRHHVGVAVAVINQEGHVLLLRHVFHPEVPWGLPGGWLGRREGPGEAALRELNEETGLVADLGPVIYLEHNEWPPRVAIGYVARARSAPMTLSGEILEAAWFPQDELPSPLLRSSRCIIERAFALQKADFSEKHSFFPVS